MRLSTFFRRVLGLARTRVRSVQLIEGPDGVEVVVDVVPQWRKKRCGSCGRHARRVHGTEGKLRVWRHLGVFGTVVLLRCLVHRVLCPRCGVKTMEVPWARPGSVFSRAFEDEVAWFLQRTDQTTTSTFFGISWPTAGRIARRVVKEKLGAELLDGLRLIGVDEISYGRPRKFVTVVVDHERGRIVWAGEGKSEATLAAFFEELGSERSARIEVVSMDMSAAFAKAVKNNAPNAEVVYDRFHVIQLLNQALDELRRAEMRAAPNEAYKKGLKGSRFAMLKNSWNCTPKDADKLSTVQHSNQRLFRGYLLRETFQNVYAVDLPEEADEHFNAWYRWARRSRLGPFRRVAATFKTHWAGVRRFIERRLTNAAVEAYNGKARMLSHRAFGFHSAKAFIAMLKLCCSGVTLSPLGQGHP